MAAGSQSLATPAKPLPTLIRKFFAFVVAGPSSLTAVFQGFYRDNNLLFTCIHLKQLASLYRAYPEQRFSLPGATITHTRSNDHPTRSNDFGAILHPHHGKLGKPFASIRLPPIPTRNNGGILHCSLTEGMEIKEAFPNQQLTLTSYPEQRKCGKAAKRPGNPDLLGIGSYLFQRFRNLVSPLCAGIR